MDVMWLERPHHRRSYGTESEKSSRVGGVEDDWKNDGCGEDSGAPDGAMEERSDFDVHGEDGSAGGGSAEPVVRS